MHYAHWQYAFLIALVNNVDNLAARIAYSIQGTKISLLINGWIAIITLVISFGTALLGTAVIGSIGATAASLIAMVMLVGLGALMIIQQKNQPHGKNDLGGLWSVLFKPNQADIDASKHIDFKEGTFLGVALSMNNIGGSLSAGVIGVSPLLVGLLSAIISFVALCAGNYAAELFVQRGIADKAAVIGGVVMIVIGVKQMF